MPFRTIPYARPKDGKPIAAREKDKPMLWTIFVILLILWLFGFISGHILGGYIHLLLVIALVVLIIRVIQGRSAV